MGSTQLRAALRRVGAGVSRRPWGARAGPCPSPARHVPVGLGDARLQPPVLHRQDVDGLVLGHREEPCGHRSAWTPPQPVPVPIPVPVPAHSLCPSGEKATSRQDLRWCPEDQSWRVSPGTQE